MDQANRLRNMMEERRKKFQEENGFRDSSLSGKEGHRPVRVISVTSGKGGVGKTNMVANLAFAFCKRGKRVLILDADLGLANMDILLGLNPRYTIQHVLNGEKRLEEVLVQGPGGFHLLPAASGIQELTELSQSQQLLLLDELDLLQDTFDILLIDTGAGISSNVMYFNFAAMEKIVIVTNEPTSLTDAYALIKLLTNKYKQKKFMILINSVRSGTEADQIFRHLSLVVDKYLRSPSIDYLGWIPYDENIPKSVRQQQTVLQLYPETRASKSIVGLADKLLGFQETADFEGDIKFFWQRLFAFER
jgi:flagellar biosynthesis protein FlhG